MNGLIFRKTVILDDDPTGSQTLQDVEILFSWDDEELLQSLRRSGVVILQTNSRALAQKETISLHRRIGQQLVKVHHLLGEPITIISRSDSTLRGHYPIELDVLYDELTKGGIPIHGEFFIPALIEAGRLTRNGIHYVVINNEWIPVGETDYAKDPVFGYRTSHLMEWIQEKSSSSQRSYTLLHLTNHDLHSCSFEELAEKILSFRDRYVKVVSDIESYADLTRLITGINLLETQGQNYLFRTAASFVKAYLKQGQSPYLQSESILSCSRSSYGGLIIVGSYVRCTQYQFQALLDAGLVIPIPFPILELFHGNREKEIEKVARQIEINLKEGRSVVCYTFPREYVEWASGQEIGSAGLIIAEALAEVVRRIHVEPSFLITKGGVTGYWVAKCGVGIRKAKVVGQILPGVPVWEIVHAEKWEKKRYVLFPGNVGDPDALRWLISQCESLRYQKWRGDTFVPV